MRATLRVLEQKGFLRHEDDGTRYLYKPAVSRERAKQSALDHLVTTFFDGSVTNVVATLLERDAKLSDEDLDQISRLISETRKEGR